METCKVRDAKFSDWYFIYKNSGSFPRLFDVPRDDFEKSFEDFLDAQKNGQFVLLIAEKYGINVGYAVGHINKSLATNGTVAWLEESYVDPLDRRKGVGTMLIEAYEEKCMSLGAVILFVRNAKPREFWSSLFYEDCGDYVQRQLRFPYD